MEVIKTSPESKLLSKLVAEKETANEFQKRRHSQWDDNYTLYRGKVKTNRITQRQAVNIPLMKETIKTLLSKIDDAPSVVFQEKSGDKQKELYINERWLYDYDRLNLEGVDIQDKKSVMLYGRSFTKMNWADNNVDIYPMDIYSVVIDPKVNPLDLETARYVIHQNIFRELNEVLADKRYSRSAKARLKLAMSGEQGERTSEKNREALDRERERLKTMGVDFDQVGEPGNLVSLVEHYTYLWNKDEKKFEKWVFTVANDEVILLRKKLKDLIGVDFYPFVSWGDDIETQDFWSDGAGDITRVINKLLNIFFSQLAENRVLRNYGMYWFDATNRDYKPPQFEPGPQKMFPAPGEPGKVIKQVEISDLRDILPEIQFLVEIIQRATATTATEKGISEKKQITLGEVRLLAGKTAERLNSIAKFYRRAWKERALKWYRILDANTTSSSKIRLYKASVDGSLWPKDVYGKDWKSKEGYDIKILSSSEQEEEKFSALQRLMLVKNQYPNNPKLNEIIKRRMLEITDLTPEEIRAVLQEDEQAPQLEQPTQQVQQPQAVPENTQEAQNLLKEVQSLPV